MKMKKLLSLILFFFFCILTTTSFSKSKEDEAEIIDNSVVIDRLENSDIEVLVPAVVFTFMDAEIKLKFKNPQHPRLQVSKNEIEFIINGENKKLLFVDGTATFKYRFQSSNNLTIYAEEFSFNQKITACPLWAILLPIALLLFWIIYRKMKKN